MSTAPAAPAARAAPAAEAKERVSANAGSAGPRASAEESAWEMVDAREVPRVLMRGWLSKRKREQANSLQGVPVLWQKRAFELVTLWTDPSESGAAAAPPPGS